MTSSRSTLGKVVAWMGILIGLTVAAVGPAGYLLVAYSELSHELSLLANLKGARLAKYIYAHQELWQYQSLRLAELTEVPEASEVVSRQRIVDLTGKLVLETGATPGWPVMARSVPILVAGKQVATVETATTLRPVLIATTAVAAFSSALGIVIFFAMRILPLRIVDQTFAELAATHARYRLLFDANPLPMVVIHRDTLAFLAVNDAATERYGWSRDEFLAMTIADLRPPGEAPPQHVTAPARRLRQGAATVREQRHRTKDGTVIEVEITSRAIQFDGQPAALSLAIDVTGRNRLESQLRQSLKMEAVGQLTGGIAHDFNNLLTVILGNIDMLEEEKGLAPAMKSGLKGIAGAADRAVELTRQLLAFSRKQPLRAEVIDLNELVAATSDLLRRSLGAQVEIDAVLLEGQWPVKVDRSQLEAVMVNLCVNARDAMPDGGKLLIETRNVTLDDRYVADNPDVVAGDYAVLIVTDNGIGMPPAVQAQVFDPFFTTKEAGKGTGLGLSMAYGFIKQSGGHIRIDSEPGRGTSFTIYLPRTTEASPEATVRVEPEMPRGDERVLVVEDEPGVRSNTVAQLRSLGYDVTHAMDGAEGLAAMEGARRPYDLLLTDVMMPRLDGKALADAVALRWPRTRIVFMSGYAGDAIVHDGVVDAGVLLLSKPFRKGELARMARRALDGAGSATLAAPAPA